MKTILACTIALAVFQCSAMANTTRSPTGFTTSPFDVAFAGYRGELRAQGIPGYQSFCNQFKWGQLSTITIAQAAARAGLLTHEEGDSSEFQGYLRLQLLSLCH